MNWEIVEVFVVVVVVNVMCVFGFYCNVQI